ncbi:hypothetical protein GF354_03690 [Candidatus Peregrinibacteria bacterium]|nr:hypothetical protein [Candidatus Peregrinibacteria bacterium]
MQLREGERVLKVFHHHPSPFIWKVLRIIVAFFPFFFLIFLFQNSLEVKYYLAVHAMVFIIFTVAILYQSLVYWLDKLVITNQRIVYINWKYLTVRDESEALLNDIQDIQTHEKGLIAYFWLFDYGTFALETASSHLTIKFKNAPDPEGIRQYVYHIRKQ